ncbi:hypothetical protein Hanom_Chr12g01086321 [Helianthus anomalus]
MCKLSDKSRKKSPEIRAQRTIGVTVLVIMILITLGVKIIKFNWLSHQRMKNPVEEAFSQS